MKRFLQAILAAAGLCSGCSRSDIMTPTQFTAEYAAVMRKSAPSLKIENVRDLELQVTMADGHKITSYLNNAYDTYKQDPKSKDDVIRRFVAAGLETVAASQSSETVDRNRIVPVIKDRPWLEETRQALVSRGAEKVPEIVYEDLNSDLVILYAEDSPKNIRYLRPNDLEKANIDRKELRTLACANLKQLLPKIERQGANGLFMITAGGDYEASLLLFDSMWTSLQTEVQGEIVVAIPTRDLLVVTGSNDQQSIEKMKQIVQKSYSEGSYRLTPKLFVYRGGKFVEFSN